MKFVEITLKEGFLEKKVTFSGLVNMIYSQANSSGKTTFMRSILYAAGYPIPSTKGIKFEDMEFWLMVENAGKQFKIYRHMAELCVNRLMKHISLFLEIFVWVQNLAVCTVGMCMNFR